MANFRPATFSLRPKFVALKSLKRIQRLDSTILPF